MAVKSDLQVAYESSSQLENLRAQYRACIAIHDDADSTPADRIRAIATMNKLTQQMGGTKRLTSSKERLDQKTVSDFRDFFGKDGATDDANTE